MTDGFIRSNNLYFAGIHLIIDLWGCNSCISEPLDVEKCFSDAAQCTGATVLDFKCHDFGSVQEEWGLTAVMLLSESHISIHTWPERNFAAVDIFMCGNCNPMDALPSFKRYFQPTTVNVQKIYRGSYVHKNNDQFTVDNLYT